MSRLATVLSEPNETHYPIEQLKLILSNCNPDVMYEKACLEVAVALSRIMSSPNQHIKILDYQPSTAEGAFIMAQFIAHDKCKIEEIDLNLGWISLESFKAICTAIACSPTLKKIDVTGKFSTADENVVGMQCLADVLTQQSNCEELNLSDYTLGAEGAKHLSRFLANTTRLHTFSLKECKIEQGATFIAKGLKENGGSLKHIDIFDKLELNLAKKIIDSIQGGQYELEHLHLILNEDCDLYIYIAGSNLHKQVKKLFIDHANITDDFIDALCLTLSSPDSKLEELSIQNTRKRKLLTTRNARKLAQLLKSPDCQLVRLNLTNHEIKEPGILALLSALETNPLSLIEEILVTVHNGDYSSFHIPGFRSDVPALFCALIAQNIKTQKMIRVLSGREPMNKTSSDFYRELRELIQARQEIINKIFTYRTALSEHDVLSTAGGGESKSQITSPLCDGNWAQFCFKYFWIESLPIFHTGSLFRILHEFASDKYTFWSAAVEKIMEELDSPGLEEALGAIITSYYRLSVPDNSLFITCSCNLIASTVVVAQGQNERLIELLGTVVSLNTSLFILNYPGFISCNSDLLLHILEKTTFKESLDGFNLFNHLMLSIELAGDDELNKSRYKQCQNLVKYYKSTERFAQFKPQIEDFETRLETSTGRYLPYRSP